MVVIGVSSEVLSYCKNKKNDDKMLKKGFELSMTHGMIRKLKALLDTYIPYHFTLRFYMKAPIICIPVKFDRTELIIHTTRDNIIINSFIFYPSILMIFVSSALFQYAASLCSKRSFQNFNSSFYPRVIILSHLRLTLALL